MVMNRSAPRTTVVPVLVYEDVGKAIDFLCNVFGFSERLRAGAPGGMVSHAQLTIGDGAVMLGRKGGEFSPPRSNEVNQYVAIHIDDVDSHYERTQMLGARIIKPHKYAFWRTTIHRGRYRWTSLDVFSIHR